MKEGFSDMDTQQNTPVHQHLWNRDFGLLVIADLFVAMGVYMQMVYVSAWHTPEGSGDNTLVWVMAGYGVGLFAMGGFCSLLVQKYRRNRVCLQSLIVMTALLAAPALFAPFFRSNAMWAFPLLRFVTGAFYGLVQMVLSSTLVIDCCEARQRTGANYATAWFYRFALSLGPLTALLVIRYADMRMVSWVSAGMMAAAFILILLVRIPFKAPEDNLPSFSLDRFLLPQAWVLFIQLFLATCALGLMTSLFLAYPVYFAWLMLGFLFALLAEKFVFVKADLKSDTVTGLLLLGAAVLLMMTENAADVLFLAPVLLGLGGGLIGSRFLFFFINLSEHCQRGTSQSTYFLAWESGLAIGIGMGLAINNGMLAEVPRNDDVCSIALACVIVALGMYLGFTHKWYLHNKKR